jgi:hypothetical protein
MVFIITSSVGLVLLIRVSAYLAWIGYQDIPYALSYNSLRVSLRTMVIPLGQTPAPIKALVCR